MFQPFVRLRKPSLIAAAVLAMSADLFAAGPKVLFIGNSFTFGHAAPVAVFNRENVTDINGTKMGGIPGILKMLTVEAGIDYDISIEAVAGQTLAFHATKKTDLLAGSGPWDVVVVQGFSSEPLPKSHAGNPQNFFVGAAEVMKLVRQKSPDAKIYAYATWSSPTQLQWQRYSQGVDSLHAMADALEHSTYKMSYDQKLTGVVRVGQAFERALDQHVARPNPSGTDSEGIDLWFKNEHRHPSPAGCYLSALMFYAKLTGKDPRQLPTGAGSTAAKLEIAPDVAANLQRIAFEQNAQPDLTPAETTTRHAASKLTVANDVIQSVSTPEGEFASVKPASALTSHGASLFFQLDQPLTERTRFALAAGAPGQDVEVSLFDATGQTAGTYSVMLQQSDFGPPNDQQMSATTFSLSDLGVADLSAVSGITQLQVRSKHLLGKILIGQYDAPAPGDDSLLVIGNGPPKVPPEKKKPAAKPAAKPAPAN